MIKKIYITKTLEAFYFLFLIVIALLALVNLSSRFPKKFPLQILSVVSGSMKPSLPVGSAVFVQKASNYYVNDIITYRYENKLVTHRVIYSGNYLLTKGDANNTMDQKQVSRSQVLGKVMFSLPYLGFLQESSKTLFGLIFFIYIPALIIIVVESKQIIKEVQQIGYSKTHLKPAIALFFGIFLISDYTYAYYSTKVLAFNVHITTPPLTASPSPSSSVNPSNSASPTIFPSSTPAPTGIGNTGNGSGSTNVVIINNNTSTTVNQSNTSTQTNTVNTTVNTGNNSGGTLNTATGSATTTITNTSNSNSVVIQ